MNSEEKLQSSAPVTVGWYLHPIEAEIARGRLESEGIPAFLHSKGHSQVNWPITLALGGIRLQVPPGAASDAAEILDSVEPLPYSEEDYCPGCGSIEATPEELSWRIAFLVVHFLHFPLPFSRGQKSCKECGARWR